MTDIQSDCSRFSVTDFSLVRVASVFRLNVSKSISFPSFDEISVAFNPRAIPFLALSILALVALISFNLEM
mgnify:CR=1 FL=1